MSDGAAHITDGESLHVALDALMAPKYCTVYDHDEGLSLDPKAFLVRERGQRLILTRIPEEAIAIATADMEDKGRVPAVLATMERRRVTRSRLGKTALTYDMVYFGATDYAVDGRPEYPYGHTYDMLSVPPAYDERFAKIVTACVAAQNKEQ